MIDSILPAKLVWGLLPRFVGALYVLAYAGLIPQLEAMIGSRGLGPIGIRLAQARRDYPGVRRFVVFPTVLWLNSSDRTLRILPWVGVACGLWCVIGGPYAFIAQLAALILWRSIEPAMLIFPWDTMLQEAGFLTLFLPAAELLPSLEASALPYPAVAFMLQFFVLRLMLGFGKVKFMGTKSDDRLYLRGFFAWSSITPVAWYAHHLPAWILRVMLYFMFVGEIIAPVLGFFPGVARLVAFGLLVSLMIGIQLTGNWGYFNFGYVLMCVCLLDTSASLADLMREPWHSTLWEWPQVALNAVMAVLFLLGLMYLLASESWTSRTSIQWPFDNITWNRPWLRMLIGTLRAISPWRIVNGYGVFPPRAQPPMVQLPVFEGSDDGVTWKAYRYRHMPTSAEERPRFTAPYHPRIDMAAGYSSTCVYDASLFGSLISDGTPYASYTRSSWLERMCQYLLAGDALMLRMLATNPFPNAPPKWMRVSTVALTPARMDVHRATGEWFHVRRLGVTVAATQRADWPIALTLPTPEVFHPDWVAYRRESAPLRAIGAAHAAGSAPAEAILRESDLSAAEVRRFWDEFVPAVNERRGDFSEHVACAAALEERFGMLQLARFERILERFAWLMRLRTERHQFADAQPKLPTTSNFRYHMFLHELVMDGEAAYHAYLNDAASAVERYASSSDEAQLWTLTMLRHRLMMHHVAAFRWTMVGVDLHKGKVPGLFEYHPLLSRIVPPSEEYRPIITKHASGEHTILGLYPPPGLLADAPAEASA